MSGVAHTAVSKEGGGSASGASATSGSTGLSTLLRAIETSFYGSFQIIQRKHVPHGSRTIIGALIKFLQISAFALATHAKYSWNAATIKPIQVIAELTTIPGYSQWFDDSAYLALYYVALAWVLVFVGLFLWATISFFRQSWPVLWPLRILAAMGTTSATIMFIPLFYLLMSGFSCHLPDENPFWLSMGYSCYSGGHLAQTVISAVLTALFVVLCAMFTLVYFDSNPLSPNLAAKAHGRADFIFLLIKMALVVLVEVFPHSVGPSALAAIVAASAACLFAAYGVMMPFMAHAMNKLMLAICAAYAWIALSLVVAQVYAGFDAAVMLYAGLPIAAVAGASFADFRARRIVRTDIVGLHSVYDVELKIRYRLHELIWGSATEKIAFGAGVKSSPDLEAGGKFGKPAGEVIADDMDGGDETEARIAQVRNLIPISTLKEVEGMMRASLAHFRTSALLHIFAARFYSTFCGNHHMEMSHLNRAERKNPPVDVRFLVFQARKHAEDGSGSKGQMSALHRVAFEKHLADAKREVQAALTKQIAFWSELAEVKPDVTRCHRLSSEMNQSINAAERAFSNLLELNSQSLLTLRLYAEFTMYVVNNQERANVLIAEAERIEEQQSKDHQRETGAIVRVLEQSNLDILADNTAVVTIGAAVNNLGIILSANAFTTKLFGYSRWQLERRNISMLIPQPFSGDHDMYLKHYLETGEGPVVDYTRVVLGMHKAGHIFPMLLCVREQPASDGPPAFVGIMRSLVTSENHMIMTMNFVITAASQASMVLMNIESSSLTTGEVKITDWVSEWHAVLEELKQPKGTTICFDSSAVKSRDRTDTLDSGHVVVPIAASAGSISDGQVWVRAHLQTLPLPRGGSCYVLHWSRMATDSYTVTRAEQRRRTSLGMNVTSMRQQTQLSATTGTSNQQGQAVRQAPIAIETERRGASSTPPTTPSMPSWHPPVGATQGGSCPMMLKVNVLQDAEEDHADGSPSSLGVEGGGSARHDPASGEDHKSNYSELIPSRPATGYTEEAKIPGQADVDEFRESEPGVSESEENTQLLPMSGPESLPSPSRVGSASNSGLRKTSLKSSLKQGSVSRRIVPLQDLDEPNTKNLSMGKVASPDSADSDDAPVFLTRKVAPDGSMTFAGRENEYDSKVYGADDITKANAAQAASGKQNAPASAGLPGDSRQYGGSVNFGDRGSHASSKKSSGKRTQDRLRRVLQEASNNLLPGLFLLRTVGYIIMIITAVLGIFVAVFISDQFATLQGVLTGCKEANELLVQAVEATRHIRYLTLCQRGWMECSATDLAESRGLTLEASAEFSRLHRDLYALAKSIHYERNYEVSDVPLVYYKENVLTGIPWIYTEPSSLLEAGLLFVSTAQRIATTPLANITRGDPSVEFIIRNGFRNGSIHDALNGTILSWLENSHTVTKDVQGISLAVYGSMVAICLVMGLFIVLPILVHVDRTRDKYILPFVQLPSVVPSKLRAHAQKRLRMLQAAEAEDDDGSSSDRSDVDDNASFADDGSVASGLDTDWGALLQAEQAKVKGKSAKGTVTRRDPAASSSGTSYLQVNRKIKKSSRSLLVLIGKFVLPLLMVLMFFTVIFAQTLVVLNDAAKTQAFSVIADQRAVESAEIPMLVRGALSYRGSPTEIAPQIELVSGLIKSFEYHHRLLSFAGVPSESILNVIKGTVPTDGGVLPSAAVDDLHEIMYGDVCVFLRDHKHSASFTMTNCTAFRDGVLTRGMHGAVTDFINLANSFLERRALANVPDNSANGEGTLTIHGNTYPYSLTAEINSAPMHALFEYELEYLYPAMSAYASIINENTSSEITGMRRFLVAFVAAFLVVFCLYQLTVYLPQVYRTNTEIKDERFMLLLLPPGILQTIPQLHQLVLELLENEESKSTAAS